MRSLLKMTQNRKVSEGGEGELCRSLSFVESNRIRKRKGTADFMQTRHNKIHNLPALSSVRLILITGIIMSIVVTVYFGCLVYEVGIVLNVVIIC